MGVPHVLFSPLHFSLKKNNKLTTLIKKNNPETVDFLRWPRFHNFSTTNCPGEVAERKSCVFRDAQDGTQEGSIHLQSFLAPSTKAGFHGCGRLGEECGLKRQRLRESFPKGIPLSVFSFIARLFVGGFQPNLISKCACENEYLHSKLQTMNLRQSRTYQYFSVSNHDLDRPLSQCRRMPFA